MVRVTYSLFFFFFISSDVNFVSFAFLTFQEDDSGPLAQLFILPPSTRFSLRFFMTHLRSYVRHLYHSACIVLFSHFRIQYQ